MTKDNSLLFNYKWKLNSFLMTIKVTNVSLLGRWWRWRYSCIVPSGPTRSPLPCRCSSATSWWFSRWFPPPSLSQWASTLLCSSSPTSSSELSSGSCRSSSADRLLVVSCREREKSNSMPWGEGEGITEHKSIQWGEQGRGRSMSRIHKDDGLSSFYTQKKRINIPNYESMKMEL